MSSETRTQALTASRSALGRHSTERASVAVSVAMGGVKSPTTSSGCCSASPLASSTRRTPSPLSMLLRGDITITASRDSTARHHPGPPKDDRLGGRRDMVQAGAV